MDPRTLRKIVRQITAEPYSIVTRINGYRYVMSYDGIADMVSAEPMGIRWGQGDRGYTASTYQKLDSEQYRKGGLVYKKAVEWCHEVLKEIRKLREGKPSLPEGGR